jgi:hypothetical protein
LKIILKTLGTKISNNLQLQSNSLDLQEQHKNHNNYLEPEIEKQFDTTNGKILRSGKVPFAEPVTDKKWTEMAKHVK